MSPPSRILLAGLEFDALTGHEVVRRVIAASEHGEGGWVVTPNVDILRATRRVPRLRALVSGASVVVPDGTPLLWAARLRGRPLAERVTGASLIWSLSEAAAGSGRSVYLLGGEPGVPERAAAALRARYPALIVAGTEAPPVGFDATEEGVERVRSVMAAAAPDIVFCGLGFPKQERLIAELAPRLPAAWFVGCGAAIPFAAGVRRRAPAWMQAGGLEWLHRLASEPRRLFGRYILRDLPFALWLLATCALARLVPRR